MIFMKYSTTVNAVVNIHKLPLGLYIFISIFILFYITALYCLFTPRLFPIMLVLSISVMPGPHLALSPSLNRKLSKVGLACT